MRLLEWTLIQNGWCPHKKRLEDTYIQKEDHGKTQGKDSHLETREASEETSLADTMILDFWTPEL